MALPAAKKRYTVAEYLALEEKAVDRHEYDDGEILMMSGGSYRHGRLTSNLIGMLYARLRGRPCEAFDANMRVRLSAARKYVYPDATIVCGGPEFDPEDRKLTTIENPRVVFEVLSDSTAAYDRGDKFFAYAQVHSIETCVLIEQDAPRVEVRHRVDNGQWRLIIHDGLDSIVKLPGFDFDLPLRELYERISFEPDETEPASPAADSPASEAPST